MHSDVIRLLSPRIKNQGLRFPYGGILGLHFELSGPNFWSWTIQNLGYPVQENNPLTTPVRGGLLSRGRSSTLGNLNKYS